MGVAQSNRRGARSPRSGSGAPVVEVWPDGSTTHEGDDGPHPSGVTFNPSAHTVAEVVAYMAAHPDEAAAVRLAESTGKARKGIIEGA